MTDLLFQMLRNGIEELRAEKYQQEKNGQAEALQITLNNLQEEVKKLNIDDVSNSFSSADIQRLLNTCDDIEDAKRLFS